MIISSKPQRPAPDSTWVIHTDGATYGSNPSMVGSGGFTVWCNGLFYHGETHQQMDTTNNQIEFFALLRALSWAHKRDFKHIEVRCDSDLVVKAMADEAKLKHPDILRLAGGCKSFLAFHTINVEWVSREDEKQRFTDFVAKLGLDSEVVINTRALHEITIEAFYKMYPV